MLLCQLNKIQNLTYVYSGKSRELMMASSVIKVELESPLEVVKGFLYLESKNENDLDRENYSKRVYFFIKNK